MPFLAHPRIEPDGRIWNLGLNGNKAMVWRLSVGGELEAAEIIELPQASYIHDFTATARHLVIVLQPWISEGRTGSMADRLIWRPGLGVKILVLDKADLSRRRIFETETFFFFHLGDAFEDGDGSIRFDACLYPDPGFAMRGTGEIVRGDPMAQSQAQLTRIALHPGGRVTLAGSGQGAEFPRSDARRAGLQRSRTIHVTQGGVGVFDWSRGRSAIHSFGDHHWSEEFLFVPRPHTTGEADGWLVGTSLNLAAQATELHVFHAGHVEEGPICTWRADIALPAGFHGTFVSAA